MTRSDFSFFLLTATLTLLTFLQNTISLCAFAIACVLHGALTLLPVLFHTSDKELREEFSKALALHTADIETLKNRVDVITLSRGGR